MLSEQELLEMERPSPRAMRRCGGATARAQFAPFAAFERLRRGCAGGRTAGAGADRESAERSDKLPDDALLILIPIFMDGMP